MVSGNGSLFISQKNTPAASTPNLQQVTDIGNATTNPVFVGLVAPVAGYRFYSSDDITFNGTNATSNYFERLAAYDNLPAIVNGPAYGSAVSLHAMQFNASKNIPQGVSGFGSVYAGIQFNFTGAFTVNQLNGIGLRAIANITTQTSINPATTSGFFINNLAGIYLKSIYNVTGATGTVSNYYGLLLADPLEEWATGTVLTTYGIYQQGINARNYFDGSILLRTVAAAGFVLDVNGPARVFGGALTVSQGSVSVSNINIKGRNTASTIAFSGAAAGGNLVIGDDVSRTSFIIYTVDNIFIGRSAAPAYTGINGDTTKGSNIVIGRQAGIEFTTNASGNVIIGNYAAKTSGTGAFPIGDNSLKFLLTGGLFNGANTAYNLLYGDFLTGQLIVNPINGVDNPSINASVQFGINSTTRGFLPPVMTAVQAEAIAAPKEGLMIYSTDGTGVVITSKGWWGYDGATWVKLN